MKLFFLGTGAADWTDNTKGEAGYRRFSSILIDDTLLIDPGPHVLEALDTFGCDTEKIKYIINTHRHSDHFNADTVSTLEEKGAELISFKAGDKKQVGKYFIEAYHANHGKIETVHYFISDGEKMLFYGLDGAWLMPDESFGLVKKGVDLAILDGTLGNAVGDDRIIEHNDLGMVREMISALSKCVKKFCITHLAREFYPTIEYSEKLAAEYGVEAVHDGEEMTI